MEEVIGHGVLAQMLKETTKGMCFFASGVSNSQEMRESEYEREKALLLKQDMSKRLVYFSSLSVFYNDTRYSKHKREMEELVINTFPKYCIIRLGNISWGDNPHTLINTLKNHVANEEPIEIKDVYRYVVDPEEFLHWISLIPDFNCEINVPGARMKVKEIFKKYV
jgi:hypothetical protein